MRTNHASGQEAVVHEVDRTGWPVGPWDSEPDRVDFVASGFACLLLRGPFGAWCGYVGVGPDHPLHGKDYGDVDVEAYYGLTYSNRCSPPICHIPEPGMPEDVWWFGFDCSHCSDFSPGMARFSDERYESYKTTGFAQAEAIKLAERLKAVAQ